MHPAAIATKHSHSRVSIGVPAASNYQRHTCMRLRKSRPPAPLCCERVRGVALHVVVGCL